MSIYSDRLRRERREELLLRANPNKDEAETLSPTDEEEILSLTDEEIYTFEVDLTVTDFGGMPDFMKKNMLKNLEKKLASEEDEDKKVKIQAMIDKMKASLADEEIYTFEVDLTDAAFGDLPDFMKKGVIKNLEKQLVSEKDDGKKAEIQAKIDKLKGNPEDKKAELSAMVANILDEKPSTS